jgi:hypothetical protein
LEELELLYEVVGVLTGDARVLGVSALGARAVAVGAGGHALIWDPMRSDLLPALHAIRGRAVPRRARLRCVVLRDRPAFGLIQRCSYRLHDTAVAQIIRIRVERGECVALALVRELRKGCVFATLAAAAVTARAALTWLRRATA